jgi:uncharacterized protein (DUF1778 family)
VARAKSLIPDRVRKTLPPPDRARDNKVTARFTEEEYELLERLSDEREERVSSFVRNLVLATLGQVPKDSRRR